MNTSLLSLIIATALAGLSGAPGFNALEEPVRSSLRVPVGLPAPAVSAGNRLLDTTPGTQDSVRFWATLSPTTIGEGELATLELNLETRGDKAELSLPDLPPELEIVGTSDRTHLQFSLPGGRSRLARREIVLRARMAGTFQIPPVIARVGDTSYQTDQLILTVTDRGGSGGRSGGATRGGPQAESSAPSIGALGPLGGYRAMARGPGDEILLRAQLIPDTVYVNQQVTLRAQTWISEDTQLRLRRAPEYHPPNIPGFWIHDLPGPIQHGRQLFGERPYRVQEFQRAYFPLGPGEYPLPPAKLVYEVRRSFLYTTDDQTLATDSLRLVVLPFPEEGRTPLFDGAVGKFNIRASLEPATVPAGEATALVLEVEGKGNLKALPPPRLPVLNGVDLYPPGENSEIDIRQGEIAGVKRFTWVIVPREPGDLEIPALEYHYFDPELRQYSVARADPLSLTVQPGEDDGSTPAVPGTLRPLKAQPTGSEPLGWVRSPLFALILAMPLLALAPLILWRRRQLRPQTAPPTSPRSRIRHRRRVIDELRGQIQGQENQFFHDLAELIRREVALFIGVNAPARGGAPQIAAALEEKGVAIATAKALGRLLGRIENARYQPVIPGTEIREELLAETERILSILDRQPRKTDRTNGRRTRGKAAPSTTITGLLLLMIPAASFAYAEHSDFQRAINHFHAGEYHSAAQGFSEYLRSSPRDQHAWYNLGNAAYLAGQRGAALQAWLHALRIAPRDGDTRHNLRLAGVDPRLIGDATRQIPISEEELFLLGGIAWLIGIGAICTYLLTRTRAHRLTGITAVGIALGVLLIHLTVPRTPAAVALSEQVPLRVAPNHRADTIRTLDEGARLLIRERRGEWLRIATTPTAEGWVEDHLVGEF